MVNYKPDAPPGYVFVSNSGFYNRGIGKPLGEPQTAEMVRARIAEGFHNIPNEAFITLSFEPDGPLKADGYQTGFATFCEEAYAPIIAAWDSSIRLMLKALQRQSDSEW